MGKFQYFIYFILLPLTACQFNRSFDDQKYYSSFDNIINIDTGLKQVGDVRFFNNSFLNIIDDFIILTEIRPSEDYGIHLFNKNEFCFIASTAKTGKGPGEVTSPGRLGVDEVNKILWLTDHGKRVIWKFYLDSVLSNSNYLPDENVRLNPDLFLVNFGVLNDSTFIGRTVRPINNSSFEMANAKFYFQEGLMEFFGYENTYAVGRKHSNSVFNLSLKNKVYINAYYHIDLITVCNLDGSLKLNIHGPNWLRNKDDKNSYYSGVDFYKDKIIASYIGDTGIIFDENKRPRGNSPTKFNVFDLTGKYIRTIETGHSFSYFCVDENNKRVIVYFNDLEPPLRYFNLDFD